MFGMSFGSQAPESEKRESIALQEEVVSTLVDFGLIENRNGITPEDCKAISARAGILETGKHVDQQAAIVLAYVDRMIAVEKSLANTDAENALLSKINTDLVASLVDPDMADNEEFLTTVLNKALQSYKAGGYMTISDALVDAVETRQKEFKTGSTVKIDKEDNVVLPSDEKQFQ